VFVLRDPSLLCRAGDRSGRLTMWISCAAGGGEDDADRFEVWYLHFGKL